MILTDRSRWEKGLTHCPRARYLEYHWGGTGLSPQQKSLPLTVGNLTHSLIEVQLQLAKELGEWPAAGTVKDQYNLGIVKQLGEFARENPANTAFMEVATLAVGMAWVFHKMIKLENKVIMVEEEINVVLGCTCGLEGQGDYKIHETRECEGVVMMTRPDFVTMDQYGNIGVWDIKTSSYPETFQESHQVQMALGSLGVEEKLGKEVTGYYIANLVKGKYDKERGQQSPLCYGYLRMADPPLTSTNVKHSYTRAKEYRRLPTWEILKYLYREVEPLSVMDMWVDSIIHERSADTDASQTMIFQVLGMYQRPNHLIESLKRQVVSYEKEWQGRLWQIREGNQEEALDRLVPCSWKCHPFANTSCAYIPVCFKYPGWEEPDKIGMYKVRAPHHELEQQVLGSKGEDLLKDVLEIGTEEEWKLNV